MMIPPRGFLILACAASLSFQSTFALAQNSEVERLSGFAKHQKDSAQYDKAREQGERAFLEETEQWENKKLRELSEYKKQTKQQSMADDGPEFQQDAAQKKKLDDIYQANRATYMQERSKIRGIDRQALKLPSEEKELGLDQERPRYDYRKRASFGATPKLGNSNITPGRPSGGGSSGGSGFGGGGPSFPPPPTFDDFQDGGGYIPAPTLDNDYMGDIPPPPPPPPPFGGDGGFDGSDFPPPPPPPTFGDDGGGDF